ncbi:hypothetical protein Pryu01_03029 [Paraliobacillus ryukyuensis]|uniref:Uncharacterized protein n=1 Tax=Paraliobacillus ryukyuensis TaxID=200904 RepID=A0A366DRD0_9BACI|nr:hypothetical protein DES48_1173 [Paraliobacillus ryukyuensis]
MKRKIASRKLKRTCSYCNRPFNKSDIYYIDRKVVGIGSYVSACEFIECPKCHYDMKRSKERFKTFVKKCHHPIVDEVWHHIPGEAVMEPCGKQCLICGDFT